MSVIGIVGGTGLYALEGLTEQQWQRVDSPFGAPSDELLFGKVGDQRIVFLPRHGRGHRIPPGEINFRANVDALKRAGATQLISVSAVGSLKPELTPGTFVIVDQFIDRTLRPNKSFFTTGIVAHVSMGHPTCGRLMAHLATAAQSVGVPVVQGGTYVVMEGPQFSSMAESELHRSWGADVIGMTNMPEAKLAREAEICYASVAMVTDYDCWHDDHAHVDVAAIIEVMQVNTGKAQRLVARLARDFPRQHPACPIGSDKALEVAIITPPEARDPELLKKLDAVAGRVLG
jgi:5'-methylthioadenosine phosphorylase